MDANELINLIINNGFPVAVTAYLLVRLEGEIKSLANSINKLNIIISAKFGVTSNSDD